jgi:hypothetical protein
MNKYMNKNEMSGGCEEEGRMKGTNAKVDKEGERGVCGGGGGGWGGVEARGLDMAPAVQAFPSLPSHLEATGKRRTGGPSLIGARHQPRGPIIIDIVRRWMFMNAPISATTTGLQCNQNRLYRLSRSRATLVLSSRSVCLRSSSGAGREADIIDNQASKKTESVSASGALIFRANSLAWNNLSPRALDK